MVHSMVLCIQHNPQTPKLLFDKCTSLRKYSYLIGATFVIRAIILVDDYGILDIDHSSMLEDDTGNEARARLRPSLYPHSVLRARKRNSRNSHVSHSSFLELLSQTSNAVSIPNKRKLYSVFAVMKVFDLCQGNKTENVRTYIRT